MNIAIKLIYLYTRSIRYFVTTIVTTCFFISCHASNGNTIEENSTTRNKSTLKLPKELAVINNALEKCCRGVMDYYDEQHKSMDGRKFSSILPPSMEYAVCPTSFDIKICKNSASPHTCKLNKDSNAHVLNMIGFVVDQDSRVCYRLTSESPGKQPKPGQIFTCHALSDLDGDEKLSHWFRIGIYLEHCDCFRMLEFSHVPLSDDM